jgi:hypothetical protein
MKTVHIDSLDVSKYKLSSCSLWLLYFQQPSTSSSSQLQRQTAVDRMITKEKISSFS